MQKETNLLTFPDGTRTIEVDIEIQATQLSCNTGSETLIFTPGKLQQAHKAAGAYHLNFGVYPYHCLRIRDAADKQKLLQQWSKHEEIKRLGRNNTSYFLWLTLGSIGLLLAFVLGFYFWLLPAFSGYVAGKISMETERELGMKLLDGVKQQYKTDDSLTRYTSDFFHSLNYPNSKHIELMVVESNDTNAFAMPGGFLIVFKGILHKTKNADQLAALLAHEYAHVRYRHSLRNLISASAGGLLLSFLAGDLSGTVGGILLSQAQEFRNLAYSRKLETEADEMGMQMMADVGAEPSAMAAMLRQIQPAGKELVPSFMSTHPVFSERIPHAKDYAGKLQKKSGATYYKKAYARMRAALHD
jgi:Zn-dependent protease with chaperone function